MALPQAPEPTTDTCMARLYPSAQCASSPHPPKRILSGSGPRGSLYPTEWLASQRSTSLRAASRASARA
jgi:hypothetical protein